MLKEKVYLCEILFLVPLLTLAAAGCGPAAKPAAGPKVRPPIEEAIGPAPAARPELSGASYVVRGKRYHLLASADGYKEEGIGSWYGGKRFQGRRTASGEKFDQNKMTAAHRTLPFNSLVEVVNLSNNKAVVVRINDRGPFHDDYVIDLSRGAAGRIGLLASTPVSVRAISGPGRKR